MPSYVLAALLAAGAGGEADDAAELARLAARCGSQIEWLRDLPAVDDGGAAFQYLRDGRKLDAGALERAEKSADEIRGLVRAAAARARAEGKLVLWHVWRIEGGHMYRAPILDDYMEQVLFTDPALVERVRASFVPLKTRLPAAVGRDYARVAWDVVEPALLVLDGDGALLHTIDRIRTFDPRWFAHVLGTLAERHLAGDGGAPRPAAADAFATAEAARLEATRAGYYEALLAWQQQRDEEALAGWRRLVEREPESPFAWRAAANLLISPDKTPAGAARHGFESARPCALPPGGELPRDTRHRRPPEEAEQVAEEALHWLLGAQRADGSWNDCRYAYWSTPAITPNAWMAVTALAATALLEWRDLAPEEVDAALVRAEAWLLDDGVGTLHPGENEECYAHAYRLLYLDRVLAQTEDEALKDGLRERMARIAAQLAAIQRPSGMWAHEYDNAFCSAAALDGLRRAAAQGIAVPETVMQRGVEALANARYDDGSFAYGGAGARGRPGPGPDHAKDSAGRSPMCEAQLLASGRSDAAALLRAIGVYREHYERMEKVAKCDFHTDGELGGFFFFHDLYHTAALLPGLPGQPRAELREWFVARLAALPEIDGSFLDDHEIGKSCSTAFALLALKHALAEEAR